MSTHTESVLRTSGVRRFTSRFALPRLLAAAVCAHLLFALDAAAADVVVVDPQGGDGVLLLQAALDAASDGDIILLRAGDYLSSDPVSYTLSGKGVVLLPDAGTGPVTVRGFALSDTSAGSLVLLRGFTSPTPAVFATPGPSGVFAQDLAGALWVEDCTFHGEDGSSDPVLGLVSGAGPAARLLQCADVALERCTLLGGRGADAAGTAPATPGADGLTATNVSRVAVHDGILSGGDGGLGPTFFASGGNGASIHGSTASVAGSRATGGHAGETGSLTLSEGGDGILVGPITSTLWMRGNTLAGGLGPTPGSDGQPLDASPSTVTTFVEPNRHVVLDAVVREGKSATLALNGLRGDTVFALLSPVTGLSPVVELQGMSLLDAALSVGPLLVGVIPAGGSLSVGVAAPRLPPGVDGTVVLLQSVFVGADGVSSLGPGTSVVVLDEDL